MVQLAMPPDDESPDDESDFEEEEAYHIDDEDGDTDSDGDICDRCDCSRAEHAGGKGVCLSCDGCNKFKDPS